MPRSGGDPKLIYNIFELPVFIGLITIKFYLLKLCPLPSDKEVTFCVQAIFF
jgi:hypothetical protein